MNDIKKTNQKFEQVKNLIFLGKQNEIEQINKKYDLLERIFFSAYADWERFKHLNRKVSLIKNGKR